MNKVKKLHLAVATMLFITHLLIGVIIVFGWLFPSIQSGYITLLILWFSCWVFLGYCPLTKWEFLLRKKYQNDIDPNAEFIQYYLYKFFKKRISSRTVLVGGLVLFVVFISLSLGIK